MRDPKRIDKLLSALREQWLRHPDYRLGQLIVVLTRPEEPCLELFSIEDDELLNRLNALKEKRE